MRKAIPIPRQLRSFTSGLILVFAGAMGSAPATLADSLRYSYGQTSEKALDLYRQGWSEILEYGRWAESERLYREALAVDQDFVVAMSVLGRITDDQAERSALTADARRLAQTVDSHGRLLLDPYLETLTLISARESGENLPDNFREDLADLAIDNYRSFLKTYPDEWAVRIEYLEWVHAKHGPREAVREIERMHKENPHYVSRLSYFPAYFYAELGDYEQAMALAERFVGQLGPGEWPQVHYIRGFIAYERGDYAAAQMLIKKALALDPRHLIAQRLQKKIDTAFLENPVMIKSYSPEEH